MLTYLQAQESQMPRRTAGLLFMCQTAAAMSVRRRKAPPTSPRGDREIQCVCSARISALGTFASVRNRPRILTPLLQEDRLRSLEGKLGAVLDHLGYELHESCIEGLAYLGTEQSLGQCQLQVRVFGYDRGTEIARARSLGCTATMAGDYPHSRALPSVLRFPTPPPLPPEQLPAQSPITGSGDHLCDDGSGSPIL